MPRSKSASRSRSCSRSRTRTRSTSRSRSSSRSRSRKRRYSSRSRTRSRSRSRSHSPPNNREKKYQRGYQNNRDFRGYHRGIRRPFNFRGRARGCFQRGRYQRGGGGYNNHNFRANWKNYKHNPQRKQQYQQHQHQHQHQQNYSQGRPQNFQNGSRSPPRDPSQHSDRSPTPLSRHSRHSSSSSHPSSPKCKQNWLLNHQNSNEVKEKSLASKVVQKEGGGDGEAEAPVAGLAADAKEETSGGKTEGNWQSSTNQTSPLASCAASFGQNDQLSSKSNPPPKTTNDVSNGVPSCKAAVSSFTPKLASEECLNSVLSSFFSNEEYLDGDKKAISIAFGKFLEEQTKKAKALENGNDRGTQEVSTEQEKANGAPPAVTSDSVPKQYDRKSDGQFSMKCVLKASPFLSADGDENEETIRPEAKAFHKDWHGSDDPSKLPLKSQVVQSARDVFDERFGQRQYVAYSQAANSDAMTEDLYLSQKLEKMAGMAAAFSKRESDLCADVDLKARKMASSSSMPSPSPAQRRNPEREMFTIRRDNSPFLVPRTAESNINVTTDFLRESVLGCSDILAEERQLSQCLVQSSKKDREFRSIFQHIQNAQLQRSPSELFAQHIVAIVHHIKAQHFPPGAMTLNERFTVYQRRAAEKETMKPRKSPEIHRRIDVSPRAFKKHSQLFEAMKSSEDDAYKDGGGKPKSDPMDLRLDIERRKKYCPQEKRQHRGRETKTSGRETSADKFPKCRKSSKKRKKRRSRSSSSSSSSSSSESQTDEVPLDKCHATGKSLNRGPPGDLESPGSVEITRPLGGFQVQIRGRGWSRGGFQGTCSHSNNLTVHPNKDEWDPEYTPKSRKYYLHDDREGETDFKCTDSRGRGGFPRGRARFIIRKATSGLGTNGPRWAQEKLGITVEHGAAREKETEPDHKGEREPAGERS